VENHDHDHEIAREERGIYLLMLLAGIPILIALAIESGEVDGGNTLSLMATVLGVVGLAAGLRGLHDRVPRARARVRATPSDRAADIRRPPR
jgi:hypothetical protein